MLSSFMAIRVYLGAFIARPQKALGYAFTSKTAQSGQQVSSGGYSLPQIGQTFATSAFLLKTHLLYIDC